MYQHIVYQNIIKDQGPLFQKWRILDLHGLWTSMDFNSDFIAEGSLFMRSTQRKYILQSHKSAQRKYILQSDKSAQRKYSLQSDKNAAQAQRKYTLHFLWQPLAAN